MDAPSLLEIIRAQEDIRVAAARIRYLVVQAAATEAIELRIIGQARTAIEESRALLAEVEKLLRPNIGPSRSDGAITSAQKPAALTQHD
jgi:hypothetical protein